MDIEQLKQELVQEIKILAEDIAKSNSFVGLLSHEIKFRSLHEKLINLKFLERKHIGLDIFDGPAPLRDVDNSYDIENAENIESIENTASNTVFTPESHEKDILDATTEQSYNTEDSDDFVRFEDASTLETIEEDQDWVENENLESLDRDNSNSENGETQNRNDDFTEFLPQRSNLPKIQLDFNDRIAFLNQLFDGDNESMDLIVNTLNHIESLNDSRTYIRDLKREMNWEGKEEYIERLEELVTKRFD
ncbi:MAG: hypothetical protein Q4G27_08270 [Flavobacteriaceae bacterium]|nr:hypothetical protein [Flavobacteriaceae bacterium]